METRTLTTAVIAAGGKQDDLFQVVLKHYTSGKEHYGKSIVAVEHDNALFFLEDDAEIIGDIYHSHVTEVHGIKCTTVPKSEHNELATELYRENFIFVIIKSE